MLRPLQPLLVFTGIAAIVLSCATTLRPGQACGGQYTASGPCPADLQCERQRGGECGRYEDVKICTRPCTTDADCAGFDTRWGNRTWTCKAQCAGSTSKICDWSDR